MDLLRMVSDRKYSIEAIRVMLADLNPGEYYGWIALAGNDAVGVTMLQPCTLEFSGRQCPAGYWTNLCVRPDYRKTTLYPRLVFTMITGAAELGMDVVYGAIRRPDVAAGHLSLGMEKIGDIPVLAKPVRPARLISKHKGFGHLAAQLSGMPDGVYSQYRSLRRAGTSSGYSIKECAAAECDAGTILPILSEPFESDIRQHWTSSTFYRRYRTNPDGDEYRVLSVQQRGNTEAVIVYRRAVRGPDIQTLVIMEMGHRLSAEQALRAGLFELEKKATASGCDVILCLSSSAPMQALLRGTGYMDSGENYILMKKATGRKTDCVLPAKITAWSFTFADHDAF